MKLYISKNEIAEGDCDWEVSRLTDSYLLKIIMFANKAGLEGKAIKEIVKIEPTFVPGLYLDFICEELLTHPAEGRN